MAWFLAKTDPQTYSVQQFRLEGATRWDGVSNPQAVQCIRAMNRGDKVLIYHSGGESAIVGLARVQSAPRPDPGQPKTWVVDMKFVRMIDPPVTLREIKAAGLFNGWALVRQGRLSTMGVPPEFVAWLQSRYAWLK